MSRALIRPIIFLLIFFVALYVLRDPLRSTGKNIRLFHAIYIKDKWPFSSTTGQAISGTEFDIATATDKQYGNIGVSSSSNIQDPGNVKGKGDIAPTLKTIQTTSSHAQSNIKPVISSAGNEITVDISRLSISGILTHTNEARIQKQIPKLTLNAQLNKAAEEKLQDMFTQQYFQHISPTGIGVSDLVRKAGYGYIVVGENLALGNFGGDPQVVLAWMNSPGHRANILDSRFQEIGIAVGRGSYNGKEQWIAVQQFAKPLSSCNSPNPELKEKIALHTSSLASLETDITTMKSNIDKMQSSDILYASTVEQYNLKANDYNTRLEGLKDEINTYNEQVRTFNSCAGLVQ